LSADDLVSFLVDKLAPFEIPREVEFRDALPKTLIGKISKKDLVSPPSAAEATQPPQSAATGRTQ